MLRRHRMLLMSAALLLTVYAVDVCAAEAANLSGKALFQQFCASCHGEQAKGDGPVAPYMRTPVPDLTQIGQRNGGAFPEAQVRRVIDGQATDLAHGSRDMPVWGWEFYAREGEDAARRH